MTPERMARLVRSWVRFYTRDLPAPIAERRIEELAADLHDHIADARARGVGEGRLARELASRTIRGMAADLAWRGSQARRATKRSTVEETMKTNKPLFQSAVRVALGVALVLSVPAIAMRFTHEVNWSVGDFVLAGVLLAVIGTALELAVRRAGSLAIAIGIGALGVAAAVVGEGGDAPGLVLLGILLIASASLLGVRRSRTQASR